MSWMEKELSKTSNKDSVIDSKVGSNLNSSNVESNLSSNIGYNVSSNKSILDEVYTGGATFGVFWAKVGAVIATVVGLIMLGVGIYLSVRKIDRETKTAKVIKINGLNTPDSICPIFTNVQNRITYQCTVTIKIDGRDDTIDLIYNGPLQLRPNYAINVYVKNDNPNDVTFDAPIPNYVGYILIGLAIFIPLVAWFWVYLTNRFKFIAFASGASGAYDLISGGRR
jgi:hypothetical protein